MNDHKEAVLQDVLNIILDDREWDYGDPRMSFNRIARLWTSYLGVPIQPQDVALMLMLSKISRLQYAPDKMDNWVDLAGYAVCGAAISMPVDPSE